MIENIAFRDEVPFLGADWFDPLEAGVRQQIRLFMTYLAGTNSRRVRRALAALFGGAVGKDTVSRAWHKVQADWEAWQKRDLAGDDIVRLILDGTVVRVRLA